MNEADGCAGRTNDRGAVFLRRSEQRVPARHPLRAIRGLVNKALADIGPELEAVYSRIGRPSIAPEKLLRALLLQLFHGIRSERQMMERLDFDLSYSAGIAMRLSDADSIEAMLRRADAALYQAKALGRACTLRG